MGCSAQREIYSNPSLPQEMRKTPNKQPKLTLKATRKRKKIPKLVEGKKS